MWDSMRLQLTPPAHYSGDCEAAEALRERLHSIARTLPDVVWSVAVPSREVLYVSPAFREVFGRPLEDIGSKPIAWGDLAIAEDSFRLPASSGR